MKISIFMLLYLLNTKKIKTLEKNLPTARAKKIIC